MNKPITTAEIVRIGNSKGLRIPKAIREQIGLEGKVTLTVDGDALVIRAKGKRRPAKKNPRAGWAAQYDRALREEGPDEIIWPDDMQDKFDGEWTW